MNSAQKKINKIIGNKLSKEAKSTIDYVTARIIAKVTRSSLSSFMSKRQFTAKVPSYVAKEIVKRLIKSGFRTTLNQTTAGRYRSSWVKVQF